MMKTLVRSVAVLLLLLLSTNKINAQFESGASYAGPSLGLSFLGSTFQLGLNYEYGLSLNQIGLQGPGKIGVGGIFRYWGYSENFGGYGNWKYSNVLIGAQGNYHFQVDGKLDPWLGLVLAYDAGSVSWDGPHGDYIKPSHGGLWLGLHGGLRYFISPKLAVNARVGFGTLSYGALEIGVDFKI